MIKQIVRDTFFLAQKSEETTKEDMDYVVDNIKEIVTKLRTMSPLYEDFVKKNN
jgi:cysteine desulfurase